MRNISDNSTYSKIIQLSGSSDPFSFVSVMNPFSEGLQFQVASDHGGMADAILIDPAGRTVRNKSFALIQGINQLVLDNTSQLANGIYFLRLQTGGSIIQTRVIKLPN
jgi:hypothetical protein